MTVSSSRDRLVGEPKLIAIQKRKKDGTVANPGIDSQNTQHPASLLPAPSNPLPRKRLKKSTLKELARVHEVAARNSFVANKRPLTRRALVQWLEQHSNADEFFLGCSEITRQHLKLIASQGGPDTRDLIGVSNL
jgi:hypothetical protein